MTLIVKSKHLQAIRKHSLICYPHECCGLLVGKINNHDKILEKVIAAENDWENQKYLFENTVENSVRNSQDSFSIAPENLIKIHKQARQENLEIIGVYHSHPNHPAIPSDFDMEIAWQTYSYIIISVKEKETKEILNWSLNSERKFVQEDLKIID